MQIRASQISDSILEAISTTPPPDQEASLRENLVRALVAFFSLFRLPLARYRPSDFASLRDETWRLDGEAYGASFQLNRPKKNNKKRAQPKLKDAEEDDMELVPAGDLGYSGSTFFTTRNGKYLIKSLPRRFEHQFFTRELFDPYLRHMRENPRSLLVRITDMVYTALPTLGGICGAAPTHHIIMENLLYGREQDPAGGDRWETYDLKPNDFFFPERDLADGRLVPDSVKARLVDEFPDTVRVSEERRTELMRVLERDTELLAENNAVDYSLFLVRYPGPGSDAGEREIPTLASDCNAWRTGVDDVEGKWTYRAVVLDFFWAKHKFHAKAMTGLIDTVNLVADQGPMSITAEPMEYRERFLKMVEAIMKED